MTISRRTWLTAAAAGPVAVGAAVWAQPGRPTLEAPAVSEQIQDGLRIVQSNAVPEHATGDFPNRHDPVPLRPQQLRLEMPETAFEEVERRPIGVPSLPTIES